MSDIQAGIILMAIALAIDLPVPAIVVSIVGIMYFVKGLLSVGENS